MRMINRAVCAATMAGLSLLSVPAMNASAATQAATGSKLVTHCISMLGEPDPVTGISKIVSESCEQMTAAERDSEVAESLNPTARSSSSSTASASNIVLVILFADLNRTGNSSAISAGSECDSAGYAFYPSTYWKSNITSLGQGNSSCSRATLTNIAGNSSTTVSVPINYVGATYNDNIGKMQVKAP